jgi:outer membrane protein OmpU
MNKLSKLGVSALCGSLAAVSAAHAGELTVTGGADMTYVSKHDSVTGNPIGIGSNFTLGGSGELDNGWSVALSIAMTNANAYSNTNVVIGIPGFGDVRIDQGVSGTGIQRMDDITPTVWEEADGAGQGIGITKIAGVSGGANVELSNFEMAPDGLAIVFAATADADSASTVGDKATGGSTGTLGSGWDLTLTATEDLHGVAGLTLYGGLSQVDQHQNAAAVDADSEEEVLGIKYAMGNFSAGYQITDDSTGVNGTGGNYENTMYSITFNVNDDLSIGYGHIDSDKEGDTDSAEIDTLQVAYTMGGASMRIARADASNVAYVANDNQEVTTISLGLAF